MPRVIQDPSVVPAARALLGATDVDGGPTGEQLAVLSALVAGYWGRTDVDLGALGPLDPAGAAAAITDEGERRRLGELLVLLELCRHPLSASQVDRVDAYLAVLGEPGPGQELTRAVLRSGAEAATADYLRLFGERASSLAEPSLRARYGEDLPAPDLELLGRLRALHDLPEGTLGWEFVEFHERNGFPLPGEELSVPAVYTAHDMCHVIGGYEPTGEGEIALGAMQLAMVDDDDHWLQFLGNLAVHEAGYLFAHEVSPKEGALSRPGATDLLAEALVRGAACTGDFTKADHLALADRPLAEVRAMFGVPPLAG